MLFPVVVPYYLQVVLHHACSAEQPPQSLYALHFEKLYPAHPVVTNIKEHLIERVRIVWVTTLVVLQLPPEGRFDFL